MLLNLLMRLKIISYSTRNSKAVAGGCRSNGEKAQTKYELVRDYSCMIAAVSAEF